MICPFCNQEIVNPGPHGECGGFDNGACEAQHVFANVREWWPTGWRKDDPTARYADLYVSPGRFARLGIDENGWWYISVFQANRDNEALVTIRSDFHEEDFESEPVAVWAFRAIKGLTL